tara:strand:+ start:589 stop:768 length:180 start_codon:yes stop_codon:yes gene_type:complete
MNTKTETKLAQLLVTYAIDFVEEHVDDTGDYDAAVCALLARALEEASGRKLKELYEIYK